MRRLISILLLFIYLPLCYSSAIQVSAAGSVWTGSGDIEDTTGGGKEDKNRTETERSVEGSTEHQVQQQLKLKKTQGRKAPSNLTGRHTQVDGKIDGNLPSNVIPQQVPVYIRHCVYRL
ncbi:hypothetical protein [uncultured Chitinophaga sp.]|uniref:hypothetical protein n=1 Tax=uncultured Chitinophaga sp. TaxID=339340 RepID=UPI0025ED32A6|nr:hypothetical protein [uncultured Chitinophaga sp.]